MKKYPLHRILTLAAFLFALLPAQAQLADVTFSTSTVNVTSYENATGGSCWETGNEEYTAYVSAYDNVNGAAVGTGCQTCDANGNCSYAVNIGLFTRTNNAYTILSSIDAWEDDNGSRCSYGTGTFVNNDDCRRQQTASYSFREFSFPSNGAYTNGPTWGSSSDHEWTLRTTWKYAGTASLLNPTCAVQTSNYSAGAIRSWSVNLVAGLGYNFNTCASGSNDTYLRLYGPDGYTLLASGDDNCGVLSIINYTAAASGTYYLEVAQFSRAALAVGGVLSYNITNIAPNNACANAIAVTAGSNTSYNTICATQDAPPQTCGAGAHNDIWYTFTPANSGNLLVSNCAQNTYDSRISVYSGTCGALSLISCSNDACGTSSSVSIAACKNVTYYISVGGNNGATGAGTLNIGFTAANTPPAITCPANISVNTAASTCAATVTYTTPAGTDNCPGVSTVRTTGLASGSSFPLGVTTNTFVATDADGATAQCSFTVTVSDNQNPSINCPANITVNAGSGLCTATIASLGNPTFSDNCSVASVVNNHPSTTYSVGTTPVVWTVTDGSGRTATCTQTVTVNDNQNPSITCPANITVNAGSGLCTATIATLGTPTTSDNCSVASVTNNYPSTSYNVGTTTVVWTVTDAGSLTSTCSQLVTVVDNQNPAITCPANFTGTNDFGQCSKVVAFTNPTGTDNCTASTTQTAGLASGSAFPVGSTTNTFTVTDAAGNTSSCTFTILISDAEPPAITCPANITGTSDPGQCSSVLSFSPPLATDNCSQTSAQIAGLPSGSAFPVGTTTNTFTATDAAGNMVSCTFTVIISDNELPTIVCPANITGNNDLGQCSMVANFTPPIGLDNCSPTTTQTAGLPSGSAFPVGTTTNAFSVTDAAGNTATCTFDIVISDSELPVITCPANITANNDPGQCSSVISFAAPTATDNCVPTTTQTAGLPSGSAFPVGTTTNAFSVTDAAGNTATCAFDIVISDNELPAVTCPANMTANNDPGQCSSVISFAAPTATDNCSPTTSQTSGLPSGSAFTVGTTTNAFSVTDAAGNTATCAFDIVISDNELPVISCPANITVSAATASCDAVVSWPASPSADNCGVTSTTASPVSGSTFNPGTTTVTITAMDSASNAATCTFTVTVIDSIAPVALCQNDTVALDSAGNGTLTVGDLDGGSTDNCAIDTVYLSQTVFSCADAGSNTIVLTVFDTNGNSSTCTGTVTVLAPAMTGFAFADTNSCGYNVSCAGGNDGIAHAVGGGGCPSYSYLWSHGDTTSTASGLSAGTYSATITDGAGNTAVVSVTLNSAPALVATSTSLNTCPDAATGSIDLSAVGGMDCQGYTYTWGAPIASTNEDVTGLSAGTYTVTVTDAGGCTTVHTTTVAAFSAPNPSISVLGNTLTSIQTWASYQWLLNGNPITGATASSYSATQTGVYSLQVTDANGCTGVSNTITVTVVGLEDALLGNMDLSIYPNPARAEFRLRTASHIGHGLTVGIHDLYGHRLFEQRLQELEYETAFDIQSFAAGSYIVEVVSEYGDRRIFRMVVQ